MKRTVLLKPLNKSSASAAIISLALSLSLLLCAPLSACSRLNTDKNTDKNKKRGESEFFELTDASSVTIVRSDTGSDAALRAAIRIREVIGDLCGAGVTIRTDYQDQEQGADADKDKDKDKDEYVILIGDTKHPESAEVMRELEGEGEGEEKGEKVCRNCFAVRTLGGKTVIAATSDALLRDAVEYYLANGLDISTKGLALSNKLDYVSPEYRFFEIIRSARAKCDIVVDADASSLLFGTVAYVVSRFNSIYGTDMKILTSDKSADTANMITVGRVGDAVSEKLADSLPANGYSVALREGRLVVAGANDEACAFALMQLFCALMDDADATIPDGSPYIRYVYSPSEYRLIGKYTGEYPVFPLAKAEKSEIISSDTSVFIYSGANELEFDAFLTFIENDGYKITSSGRAESVFSAQAQNDKKNMSIDIKMGSDGIVKMYVTKNK